LSRRTKPYAVHTTAAATAGRRGVAWFAVFGLLFQLFLVTSHIHVDEDGWLGLPSLPGVAPLPEHRHELLSHRHEGGKRSDGEAALSGHGHGPGAVAGNATPAGGSERVKHPDCQVCQSSPVVSASSVAVTIEFALAVAGAAARPRISEIDANRIEPEAHAQPRAPPTQA
jgi:hypothetical protein